MPKKSSTRDSNLPSHLRTEVGWWRSFLVSINKSEAEATAIDVASFFLTDRMVKASIAVRLSCYNALSQYYRERHDHNPFAVNPYPYPLLKRYVPDFDSLYKQVLALEPALKAYGLLMLLARMSVDEVMAFDTASLTDYGLIHDGRVLPLKQADLETIRSCFVKPTKDKVVSALCGYRLQDYHSATIAYLFDKGVSEEVVMAIYGRQSAMKVGVARHNVGLFRTRLI